MSFMDGFRQGREHVRAARAGTAPSSQLPPRPSGPTPPAGNSRPSPISFGYHCLLDSDDSGAPLASHTERHVVLSGLNGAGKSTRFLIELLATTSHRSLVVFDIKGELAWQTAHLLRRRHYDVKVVNPMGVLGMRSDGFNLLSGLDRNSPKFYDAAARIADALIEIESGSGQYWTESAQGLLVALIMWEVIIAKAERALASQCAPHAYRAG